MVQEVLGYLALAQAGKFSAWLQFVLLLAATCYFLVCSFLLWRIDLAQHRLPDKIVLPMYVVLGFALLMVRWLDGNIAAMRQIAYCAVFLAGAYFLLRLLSRGALGLGDVKLAGVIGMVCGYFSPLNMLWASLIAFLAGGAASCFLVLSRRASPSSHIAFGPFMLAGAIIAFFFPI